MSPNKFIQWFPRKERKSESDGEGADIGFEFDQIYLF